MKLETWDLRLGTKIILILILSFILPSCITLHESNFFFPKNKGPLPPEAGVAVEQVGLPSGNDTISGVIIKNPSQDYLLYFYGNGQSIYDARERLLYLSREFNLNVVCFDYRGYGASTGKPTFDSLLSDAAAIYEFVLKKKPRRLFIFSQSIGTVPCTFLGSKHKFDGIIMEACFTSAEECVPRLDENSPVPLKWFVKLTADEALLNRRPQPVDMIKYFSAPLLMLHGTADEVFPQDIGRKMFEAAGSKDKVFCSLPGVGHSNVNLEAEPAKNAVKDFFSKNK
jgi:pimeloyl-ACP methyl ester carboxylesterase